jgi:hypothetical protein
MKLSEIKNCPNCGGKAIMRKIPIELYKSKEFFDITGGQRSECKNKYTYTIFCHQYGHCGIQTPFLNSQNEAIKTWNW